MSMTILAAGNPTSSTCCATALTRTSAGVSAHHPGGLCRLADRPREHERSALNADRPQSGCPAVHGPRLAARAGLHAAIVTRHVGATLLCHPDASVLHPTLTGDFSHARCPQYCKYHVPGAVRPTMAPETLYGPEVRNVIAQVLRVEASAQESSAV